MIHPTSFQVWFAARRRARSFDLDPDVMQDEVVTYVYWYNFLEYILVVLNTKTWCRSVYTTPSDLQYKSYWSYECTDDAAAQANSWSVSKANFTGIHAAMPMLITPRLKGVIDPVL